MYNKCRTTDKPLNSTYWPVSDSDSRSCSLYSKGGHKCDYNLYCGNPIEFGINIKYDNVINDVTI
jgi:hypothetical protein